MNVYNNLLFEDIEEIINNYTCRIPLKKDYFKCLSEIFTKTYGIPYNMPISSGTAALHTALAIHNIQPLDEVIIPVNTCAAVPMAVLNAGCIPKLVDIDDSLTMSADDLENKLGSNTRAVVVTHQFGIPANIKYLIEIIKAKSENILIIEDCAQAHGATIQGKPVGNWGDVAIFSFNQGKIINAGMGGILGTKDDRIYEAAKQFANLGAKQTPFHLSFGYQYNISEIQAALIIHQMNNLEKTLEKRKAKAEYYMKHLKPLGVKEYKSTIPAKQSYHRLIVQLPVNPQQYEIITGELNSKHVRFQSAHPVPLYKAVFLNEFYKTRKLDYLIDENGDSFPITKAYQENMLFLYTSDDIEYKAIDHICEIIGEYLTKCREGDV